jgi:hypothetical protein
MRRSPQRRSGRLGALANSRVWGGGGRRLLGARRLPEFALFLVVYVLYDAARWLFAGRLPAAREHADRIIDLERSLQVGLAFAIGFAAYAAQRARWARALALLWGPLVSLSVVATGNHGAVRLLRRLSTSRPRAHRRRRLIPVPATRSAPS